MEYMKDGDPWPQGEASYANELGRLHGFRRWCETPLVELRAVLDPPVVNAPLGLGEAVGQGPAQPLLAPLRLHLACKLGRKWV